MSSLIKKKTYQIKTNREENDKSISMACLWIDGVFLLQRHRSGWVCYSLPCLVCPNPDCLLERLGANNNRHLPHSFM